MATFTERVVQLCQRLAPFGWATLLRRHGLDLEAADLPAQLYKDLSVRIDRSIAGFEDFRSGGRRAIEPYAPGGSLLLHAFASPDVHPGPGNSPHPDKEAYPTLQELDLLENFIFSTEHEASGVPVRDERFFANAAENELVIAVFAYQYRTGARSANRQYADFAYSRTGVARVGTTELCYVPSRRTFWTIPDDGADKIPVLPARYGVFLAERREIAKAGDVLGTPDRNEYLFPLHKLFPGPDCIGNLVVPEFTWRENHFSDKLKRGLAIIDPAGNHGFDLNSFPFIVSSKAGTAPVRLQTTGASALLVPVHAGSLVEVAEQNGQVVNFEVPRANRSNRFSSTSYWIQAIAGPGTNRAVRRAPEYLNIRFELTPAGKLDDVSGQFAATDHAGFLGKVSSGGYQAVLFTDNTCDGCIVPEFNGPAPLANRVIPAYSLVTAPDFFPLCDQTEITQWANANGLQPLLDPRTRNPNRHFDQGGPEPLSEERFLANPLVEHPLTAAPAFGGANAFATATAIVSMSAENSSNRPGKRSNQQVSYLPDAASGVFAPGWDVSMVGDPALNQPFLSSYGLGSPFPEDSKLCAALNSFWPAVAPDASRTFLNGPTAFPMLDDELGYHPQHPLVLAGKVAPSLGWDGEQGPFFTDDFEFVNFTSLERSDYTANALAGNMSLQKLCTVDAEEWISRMTALRNCIAVLPPPGDQPISDELKLISARKIDSWESQAERADIRLFGKGYLFEFAAVGTNRRVTNEPKRLVSPVISVYTCHLSDTFLFWQDNAAPGFTAVRRPNPSARVPAPIA